MSEFVPARGGPTLTLATGATIPQLGLGVWQIPDGDVCERAVLSALECGYRLIDTAQLYGNESSVGRAIRRSGIARKEVFLTTKFYPGFGDPLKGARDSLDRLGTDYIDLYLVHWPEGGATWAWPGMEAAVTSGLVNSIGVSNFDSHEVTTLMEAWTVPPVINQFQVSPFEYRRGLIAKSRSEGLAVQAYSPLGSGRHLTHPVLATLADQHSRTPAQLLLRWGIQRGLSVITKTVHRTRMEESLQVFDFELDQETMERLDALDTTGQTDAPLETRDKWR